ncbi:Uncharacterised protein [Salmonella enterica subsp. enterica serovar Typhi]|nr:Uncharacterised protein [Salmonella enterica subsp. enterica serovar Typhi]CGB31138.1 Uncharacterised protein [Salmonella enterica subsp. enterica serovar Typhi]CGB54938.1 Uncharacterised protein [Salmonella enterica subsp. enterica serovar Typhi]CGB59457.1 Uncharacterised protein [Salmonella enterica subsp. enterica serovar Typhi]CGB65826.1 Uncharacterised protein [Salmonella enterica subsp. enterica serovar Typhi]
MTIGQASELDVWPLFCTSNLVRGYREEDQMDLHKVYLVVFLLKLALVVVLRVWPKD